MATYPSEPITSKYCMLPFLNQSANSVFEGRNVAFVALYNPKNVSLQSLMLFLRFAWQVREQTNNAAVL